MEEPRGTCIAAGDPHYISFDGAKFDFMGTCRYLLAGATDAATDVAEFRVEVQMRQAWSYLVSMTEQVWISFRSKNGLSKYVIHLQIADPVQVFTSFR